jgi:putative oxygen-independent coproporphyrinogen III oxidase
MHLYLHVPFCARRCSYCDFAIAVRHTVPSERYADAILAEWEAWQDHPAWGASPGLDTVYFGGGTPSLLGTASLARIVDALVARRGLGPNAELTLEVNPDDVTPASAAAWRGAGVNRISLGVQSFNPRVLAWMHRTHTQEQVPVAVAVLREAGLDNISLDLIFGLPTELGRSWSDDLDQALRLEPLHLSVYGLTVESHTPLARWVARGETRPPLDASYAEEFLTAHARLTAAGYEHYEVSNYGRPGRRAIHNQAYWKRAPFVGLGPSAHSGFQVERRWNQREWAAYDAAISRGESPVAGRELLDADALRIEGLYLGLRTLDGLPAAQIPGPESEQWSRAGWLVSADGRSRLTPEGWLRMDALIAQLL